MLVVEIRSEGDYGWQVESELERRVERISAA